MRPVAARTSPSEAPTAATPPLLRALAELFGIDAASLSAWELPQVVQGAYEDLRDRLPWSVWLRAP
eukprot:4718452-Alexandrium_andersonii.AAC.1